LTSPHAHASAWPDSATAMAELWQKNRARLADDHLMRRTVSTARPAHMKIELTNYCNLACPMCPHEQMEREVGYMRPELFRRIIDQATPELEFAYLHHLGESLFHGRIGELITYARDRGVAIGLSTNATYLDPRKGKALLDSGLDFLVISLDGASPDTYDRIRVGGDFPTTVRNVRAFFEQKAARPGHHLVVVVQMIVTPENHHEVRRFAEQWRGTGAQVMIKEARDWAGQVKLVQLGKGAQPRVAHTPCKMLWTELTVLWDGAVVPCVNVYERQNLVGDLSQQTLDEVWNSPAMLAYRAAHLADTVGHIPVCATCPRHPFDHEDFVALDQLGQRLRNYIRTDLVPQPGLS
jgi:radical SAM protein with 4Fe4S-binding SPASM domain